MAPRDFDAPRRLSLLIALLAATALATLLWHLIYRGAPHSFDPMIYARSIWGIARGDFFNPVVSSPVFGIHGQFVQLLLAPLTLAIAPAMVLVIAQAIAFGATVWLVADEFGRTAAEQNLNPQAAVAAGAALTIASPLVVNPFLFDVRPEMLGIPLLVAAGLRVLRREELDRTTMALLFAGLLVREDFAFFVAPAIVLFPTARGISMRGKIIGAGAAAAYVVLYFLVLRRFLGGAELVHRGLNVSASMLDPTADPNQRSALPELVRYKSEILLVTACTMGGFVLRSRRWFLLAVPGLLALLAVIRGPQWELNTHYAMFAAPGLIIAGVAGYRLWVQDGRPYRWATIAIAILAAGGAYAMSSAAPGGGRYLERRFGWSPLRPLHSSSLPPALVPIRETLDKVPRDAGLVVPYVFGAPVADRRMIIALESLPPAMLQSGTAPDGVDWVAVTPPYWPYGRLLVQRGGFVVDHYVPGSMVLLTRRK